VANVAGSSRPHSANPAFLAAAISVCPCLPGISRSSRRLGGRACPAAAAVLDWPGAVTTASKTPPSLEVCVNHLGARTMVRQFPESCRRNATPNDRTRTPVASTAPQKLNQRCRAPRPRSSLQFPAPPQQNPRRKPGVLAFVGIRSLRERFGGHVHVVVEHQHDVAASATCARSTRPSIRWFDCRHGRPVRFLEFAVPRHGQTVT
jgi:hypothetical protein